MEPSRPLTAEEEAAKRNTDCVYFLASPLTCKKGSGCEFRHSEGARVNPRDCWYWLNGNCMNPKCSFRHPPLDGLFETPMAPSGPAPPTISAAPVPGAYNPNKQSVPCHFFQKGQCLKGDRCPFMHGTHPAANHEALQAASGPQPVAKASTSTQQNILKPVRVLPPAKSLIKAENVPNNETLTRSRPIVAPVSSESTPSRPRPGNYPPVEERRQNGREIGEFLRESSPGFDVLVHDNIGDSDHYNVEEIKQRNFDRDEFNGKEEHDRHARRRNQRDQDGVSLERTDRLPMPRRSETDGADLRQRLLKKRRLDRSRSAVGPDCFDEPRRWRDDRYAADGYRGRSSGGDRRPVSSRLQGRITLPPSSSPDRPVELRPEQGCNRSRHRARLSPATKEPLDFAGPKSLAELIGVKNSPLERPVPFEGPKSLTDISKGKSGDERNATDAEVVAEEGEFTAKDEDDDNRAEGEELLLYVGQGSAEGAADEMDDVRPLADGIEDQDLKESYENYRNEYETVENAYPDEAIAYGEDEEEEEELDDNDDDEDDFAKRVGEFFT